VHQAAQAWQNGSSALQRLPHCYLQLLVTAALGCQGQGRLQEGLVMCCSVGLSLDALMMSLAWLCCPVGSVDALQQRQYSVFLKWVLLGLSYTACGTQLRLVSGGE